jgi:mercuric ion transport protein
MKDRTLIGTGAAGTTIAAVCCFTPLLVVTLPAVGLAAWLGWIDYVLFPALAFFAALTAYGFYRQRRATALAAACCATDSVEHMTRKG